MIHVGVFKRLSDSVDDELDEMDAMAALCEEIRDALNRVRPSETLDAICTKIVQEPVADAKTLNESRCFLSVLACTFTASVEVT